MSAYRARLREARSLVSAARGAGTAQRDALIAQARGLLRTTTAVTLADGAIAVDDGPLADRISATTLDRELAELDDRIALADQAAGRRVNAASADATLRDLVESQRSAQRANFWPFVLLALARLAEWLYDLIGRPDPVVLARWQGLAGVLVGLAIVALLVRGVRERIRRETVLATAPGERRADPSAHLRAADDAIRAGAIRDAIHSLYLFALTSLAAREAIRYDPSLTDREVLARAAAIPHADALRDLVAIYERSWFGIREPSADEARRARDLAMRVAP